MFDLGLKLEARCHINENGEGDRFVGIKADSDNAMVYFPMGYQLPESEEEIRQDILQLIAVLSEFSEMKDRVLHMSAFEAPQTVNFPIDSYMSIIRYYLDHGYYMETERITKRGDRGHIDFKASLRHVSFFQEDGSPFFDAYEVRGTRPNEKNLITQINKYCVYVSFKQLGWLFTKECPPDPRIEVNHEKFLMVLRSKLASEHVETTKLLFKAMIALIDHLDKQTKENRFYFGTDRFEYVWERLIDSVFGIKGKEEYFPRTHWMLSHDEQKDNHALEPDSIMLHDGKIYVLDAKYYRYGITGMPKHLPESTSINKQITYGEYIHEHDKFRQQYGDDVPVFNAFLMPYNRMKNKFGVNGVFESIGEATSDWKHDEHPYQRVQGIVIDTRFLLYNYYGSHTSKVLQLAAMIDESLRANGGTLPADPPQAVNE